MPFLQHQNSDIEMAATAVTEMSQAVDEVTGNAALTEYRQAAETVRRGQQQLGNTLVAVETLAENVMVAGDRT